MSKRAPASPALIWYSMWAWSPALLRSTSAVMVKEGRFSNCHVLVVRVTDFTV
ncbi:hypothetical protein [Streptomyces sp. Tue6028]|uniref:hypothetical protein n=1 Tax=Streptomyces sp. Tue6028 TaxID=2036037 RepID=UPI003F4A2099